MTHIRITALALIALCLGSPAWAASTPVFQTGVMTPQHLAKFFSNGLIGDVGGLTGDANGRGVAPFIVQDNHGLAVCTATAATGAAHNRFCLGHDSTGNPLLSLTSQGGETDHGFKIDYYGTTYDFNPAGTGNVAGPGTSTTNGLMCWANTNGTLSKDCPTTGSGILTGITQTLTGADSVQRGAFNGYPQNLFVTNSTAHAHTTGTIGTEFDYTNAGGYTVANATHIALVAEAKQTGAMSFASGKQESIQGAFIVGAALATQGGTPGGANAAGAVWGVSTIANLYNGATGFVSLQGNETDVFVESGANVNNRFGYNAVDYGSGTSGCTGPANVCQGSNEDSAYSVNALTGSAGWRVAYGISKYGGPTPMSSNGTLMKNTSAGTIAIADGIDLRGFTFSDYAFAGPSGGFLVDGPGNTTVNTLLLLAGGGTISGAGGLTLNGTTGTTLKANNATGATLDTALNLKVFSTMTIGTAVIPPAGSIGVQGDIITGGNVLHKTSTALTNGAAAATATLTNAPTAGNPTKWISISDNGTTRFIPAW